MKRLLPALVVGLLPLAAPASVRSQTPIRFGRDVLPILSENCFACHGPDPSRRKADLRLDTREGALAVLDLKNPAEGELLVRVRSDDPEEVMPPPSSHKKRLTPKQVDTLRRWVEAGAPWGRHWAFERPVKVDPPKLAPHPIDAFVRDGLKREGIEPAPEVDPRTLARRVSFDLTGMPPSTEEIDAFLADRAKGDPEAAYGRLVDRLLASEHYGERMAMWWLDAARYADTDGYQGDDTRTNWPWRDWVVRAFNRNQTFDKFTIEQFAGDLLPNATADQILATCFHRNHMTNGEGGRDPEESRIDYVIDRVNTVGSVWLGLTLGCAQCHSHKFDPITQKDYYSLNAFFNSIDETGGAGRGAKPALKYRSPFADRAVEEARKLVDLRKPREARARAEAEGPFERWLAAKAEETRGGFAAWRPVVDSQVESVEGTTLTREADGTIQASGSNPRQDDYRLVAPVKLPRVTGLKLEILPHASHTDGKFSRGASGEFILTDVKIQTRRRGSSQIRDLAVAGAVADASTPQKEARDYGDVKGTLDDDPRNGWTTRGIDAKTPHVAVYALAEPVVFAPDEDLIFELRQRSTVGDANVGRFRVYLTDQAGPAARTVGPAPLERLAAAGSKDLSSLDKSLHADLFEQFLTDFEPYQVEKAALDRANRQFDEATNAAKTLDVMVLAERKDPRPTHVLIRGVWDKKGEVVPRGVPDAIAAWRGDGPRTREDLARWIVSAENPLTARVIVNQVWQLFFGAGLVRTPEDFGLQGEAPTHPELLDWLAVDFVEHGWDLKRLARTIATSATYRQSSALSAALLVRDPENRLLARGARFRLPSWMLRDAALKSSGLLVPAVGGPPTRPYQPDGVWEEMFMGRFRYEPSEGPAQHRRTLYAFWRRAVAPTFLFDSAQRRVCEVRQTRTNTPLQALTLLNDANYLAAARALAESAVKSSADPSERLAAIFRRVLSREPREDEAAILKREWARASDHYRTNPTDAEEFLRQTRFDRDDRSRPNREVAAYALVASLILNLDEAINHE